jgi:hypothetical protein
LSEAHTIDARFFGLLFMLRKQAKAQALSLTCTNASPRLARLFRLNRAEFLLASDPRGLVSSRSRFAQVERAASL